MKKIKKIKLYGYTVRGYDRRDDSTFEDFYVTEGVSKAYIKNQYAEKGFAVEELIPEDTVCVDFDLMELYAKEKADAIGTD